MRGFGQIAAVWSQVGDGLHTRRGKRILQKKPEVEEWRRRHRANRFMG